MDSLNWTAIILITIGNFILGALWFGPIFGTLWMRIHHGDRQFSDTEMKEMTQDIWKILIPEFIATALMVFVLALLIEMLPGLSGIYIGLLIWVGFVMPEAVSAVLWGNDAKKWMPTKIALSSSYRLVALAAAGYLLAMW